VTLAIATLAVPTRAHAQDALMAPTPAPDVDENGAPRVPAPRPSPPAEPSRSARSPFVHFTGHADAGAGARWLFGDALVGAAIDLGIGLRFGERVHLYHDVRLLFADVGGLFLHQYETGPALVAEVADHVLVGGSVTIGGTTIERVTTGGSFAAFSVGLHLQATYDVIQLEHARLGVVGGISFDSAGQLFASDDRQRGVDATVIWGPTLGIGARF